MTLPWHLDALGLPAHADEIAVRRAYAAAVRKIDPATDADAFQNLRHAYEAARTWCEQMGIQATGYESPAGGVENDAADEKDKPSSEESPALPLDYTVTLAWRFAADVGARRAEGVPRMLDDILAELRTQYIDAPGQFEEHLIDLIGLQRIAHRAEVFAAAETSFHWNEVGHLAALGQRGQWIEGVLSQREAWLSLAVDRQRAWLKLFARAETHLDKALARHWPEISALNERFPAWVGLHLSGETLQAWHAAFDAQSPSTREMFTKLAPPEIAYLPAGTLAARERMHQRSTSRLVAFLVLTAVVGIVNLAVQGWPHSRATSTPSPLEASLSPDTPRQCVELYTQLDKPDAFEGKRIDEIDTLKARAHRCQRAGHWHAQARQ